MAITKSFATALNMPSGGTPASSRTTASFNSTGFTHIVVGCKHEGAVATITPSDNKSTASWTSLTKQSYATSDGHVQLFHAKIGSPGTSHTATITLSAARTFITVAVWLINADSGAITLIDEDGATGSGTAIDAGTLANAGGVSVVSFMLMGEYSGSTHTGAAGWTEDFDLNGTGGDNFTAGYSRGAETGTSIDPSGTQSISAEWGAVAAMFAEDAGGGATIYNRTVFDSPIFKSRLVA